MMAMTGEPAAESFVLITYDLSATSVHKMHMVCFLVSVGPLRVTVELIKLSLLSFIEEPKCNFFP